MCGATRAAPAVRNQRLGIPPLSLPRNCNTTGCRLACRRVLELAQLLSGGGGVVAALGAQLSSAVAAVNRLGASGLSTSASQAALSNADAAVLSAKGCIACALQLGWQGSDARRVCSTVPLVLQIGRQSLAAQLAAVEQCRQRGEQPSAAALAGLWNSMGFQLSAVSHAVGQLAFLRQPDLAASVAATAAPPRWLLPWLQTACEALLAACCRADPGNCMVSPVVTHFHCCCRRHMSLLRAHELDLLLSMAAGVELPQGTAVQLCVLLHSIGTNRAYTPHQQQLTDQSSSRLRSALAAALTQWVWPCLAGLLEADCSSADPAGAAAGEALSALIMLGEVMAAEHMKHLFRMAAFAPGSLAAGVGAAARIAQGLPSEPPPSLPPEVWGLSHVSAATFLGLTAAALLSQPSAHALQLQLTAEHEEGPRASQEPATARQLEAGAAEALEAAWAVLLVLPHAAAVLTSLATSSLGDVRDDYALYMTPAVRLLQILPKFDAVSQAAEWVAASRAMLRLLPLLGQLDAHSTGSSHGSKAEQPDAWWLASALLRDLWEHGSTSMRATQLAGDRNVQMGELATAAHMAACRTMHALAAAAEAAGGPSGLWQQDIEWATLAGGMNECLAAIFAAQAAIGDARR